MTPLQNLMRGKKPGAQGDLAAAYALGRDAALERTRTVASLPLEGCGDHSCVVRTSGGVGTNGGCRCGERELRRAVQILKAKLDAADLVQR